MTAVLTMIWIGIASVILVCSIPRECWRTSHRNCRRQDGTLSRRRLQREISATWDYGATLMVPLLLATLTLFIVLYGTFTYLMPAGLMVDAADALISGSRPELDSVRRQHTEEFLRRGHSAAEVRDLQRFLWHNWLILGFVGLSCFIVCAWFVLQVALREAVRFAKGVRLRRQCYVTEDTSKMLLDSAMAPVTPSARSTNSVQSG